MGMDDKRISHPPVMNIQHWFFLEFLVLYNTYKLKHWAIPSNFLFSNLNYFPSRAIKEKGDARLELLTEHSILSLLRDENRFVGYRNLSSYSTFLESDNLSRKEDFLWMGSTLYNLQVDLNPVLDEEELLTNIELLILFFLICQKQGKE